MGHSCQVAAGVDDTLSIDLVICPETTHGLTIVSLWEGTMQLSVKKVVDINARWRGLLVICTFEPGESSDVLFNLKAWPLSARLVGVKIPGASSA